MAPDPQRRSRRSHGAILTATIEQLTRVGYHRLTIEGVAARAGVGKATVYRWWPTKARLVVEALSEHFDLAAVESTGDFRADVRGVIEHGIEVATKTSLGSTLLQLAGDLADDPDARADLQRWLGPFRAGNLALVYGAVSRADLPHDVDANLLLDIVAGTILYRGMLGVELDTRLIDQLTSLIVDREIPRTLTAEDRLS